MVEQNIIVQCKLVTKQTAKPLLSNPLIPYTDKRVSISRYSHPNTSELLHGVHCRAILYTAPLRLSRHRRLIFAGLCLRHHRVLRKGLSSTARATFHPHLPRYRLSPNTTHKTWARVCVASQHVDTGNDTLILDDKYPSPLHQRKSTQDGDVTPKGKSAGNKPSCRTDLLAPERLEGVVVVVGTFRWLSH